MQTSNPLNFLLLYSGGLSGLSMKGGGEKDDEEFEAKITAFFQGKEAYHQDQLQIKVIIIINNNNKSFILLHTLQKC